MRKPKPAQEYSLDELAASCAMVPGWTVNWSVTQESRVVGARDTTCNVVLFETPDRKSALDMWSHLRRCGRPVGFEMRMSPPITEVRHD
jgi:hypothetical protein